MIPSNLSVFLYGEKIGSITYLGSDRSIFSFEEAYIENPKRPTLSLSFKNPMGELITHFPSTQTQLIPWFSNLLPEGPLREYLAKKSGVKPMREYNLIAELGRDLPGAVTIYPSDSTGPNDEIESVKNNNSKHQDILKFSLAGVQLKFSALTKRQGGLTIPAHGTGGDWIVKLPSLRFEGLSQNEFSMMTLAKMIGMDIPEFKLMPLSSIEGLPNEIENISEDAFAIRRFDRNTDGTLVHIEDFAQVYGVYPERKYERASARSIASVLWIETGADGLEEFIKRLVFNTLIGNADMHLKNWSLIYPDRVTARLAPGYDFVSTIPYITDENAALKYARTKRMSELGKDELSYLASKAQVPHTLVLNTARETVDLFMQAWEENKINLPMSQNVVTSIEQHIKKLALLGLQ